MKKSILLSRSFAKAKLQATSLWLVAAIIAMAFAACTKKSDTQMQTVTAEQAQAAVAPSNPYPEIRNGDLSAFAGIWENPYGSIHLGADGSIGSGTVGNFEWGDGVYVWYIYDGYNSELQEYQYSTGVMLYSAGIEIRNDFDYEIVQSDTTKVRIAIGRVDTSAQIYYRQGEAAIANSSNPYAKVLSGDFSAFAGTWVNGEASRSELKPNGIFGNYDDFSDIETVNFHRNTDGSYTWTISTEWFGSPITIYPVGIAVIGGNGILQTDTTKVRITAVDIPYRSEEVYYRQGELPAAQSNSKYPQFVYPVQFNNQTIPITVFYSVSGADGEMMNLDRMVFMYGNKEQTINLSPKVIEAGSPQGFFSYYVLPADYNFDGFLDFAVHHGHYSGWDPDIIFKVFLYNQQTANY